MNITYIDSCSKWEDDDDEKKRNDFVVSEGGGKVVFNIKWVECHRCLANKTIFSFGYCSKPTFMFVLSLSRSFFLYIFFSFALYQNPIHWKWRVKYSFSFSRVLLKKINRNQDVYFTWERKSTFFFPFLLFRLSFSLVVRNILPSARIHWRVSPQFC